MGFGKSSGASCAAAAVTVTTVSAAAAAAAAAEEAAGMSSSVTKLLGKLPMRLPMEPFHHPSDWSAENGGED
jgi:hypothetical protein